VGQQKYVALNSDETMYRHRRTRKQLFGWKLAQLKQCVERVEGMLTTNLQLLATRPTEVQIL
jgi:hypothetical protein